MVHFKVYIALLGVTCAFAKPQGYGGAGGTSSSASSSSGGLVGPTGGGSGSGSSSGGNTQVSCQRQEVSPGNFKFVCSGADPNAIKLRSQHILWLPGPNGQQQAIDIDIPNYKIEELIKAGFKPGPGGDTKINVLLRKPDQTYDAQVAPLSSVQTKPQVNLQYEPVKDTLVHFPTQKQYSPLQGPLLPPSGPSASQGIPLPPAPPGGGSQGPSYAGSSYYLVHK